MEPRPPRLFRGRHAARTRGPRRAAARAPVRAADGALAAERRAGRVGAGAARSRATPGARPPPGRVRAALGRPPAVAPRLLRVARAARLRRGAPPPRLTAAGRASLLSPRGHGALAPRRARAAERRR